MLPDIIMPGMDGFELYKQIKKLDRDVLVCFLTASEKYRQELRDEEYCALNKDLFFQKPISIKDLIRDIEKVMNKLKGIKSKSLGILVRIEYSNPTSFIRSVAIIPSRTA